MKTAALLQRYEPLRPPQSLQERAAALDAAAQTMSAQELVVRAIGEFRGRIALVSSFGAESAPLLHLVASADPAIPVIFLETDKHFVQTGAYRDELAGRLGLSDLRIVRPDAEETRALDPKGDLWRRDNDSCCALRKVRPLKRALESFDAWITGRKRMHGNLRSFLPLVEAAAPHIKVNPLARWTPADIDAYAAAHDLPPHPLVENGFTSIGCWPCTAPTAAGDDARAGRWRGLGKTECGIHRI
jgi:phosphoadenosine phosphosulfate reductase